jgi:hypothetical protein
MMWDVVECLNTIPSSHATSTIRFGIDLYLRWPRVLNMTFKLLQVQLTYLCTQVHPSSGEASFNFRKVIIPVLFTVINGAIALFATCVVAAAFTAVAAIAAKTGTNPPRDFVITDLSAMNKRFFEKFLTDKDAQGWSSLSHIAGKIHDW